MDKTISVVSGLPRSGTSMMMRMLAAGGMEVITDNIRKADEDNPEGYYEFEKAKKIRQDASWLDSAQGKVFKMVSMLLYDLPSDRNYKIVFMKRNMDEILASQRRMLIRQGRSGDGPDDKEMGRIFAKHLRDTEEWLGKQKNTDVLYMNYNEIVRNPVVQADILKQFFGSRLNAEAMAGVIERNLYRNRA
ncbi:MAG: sulfotransferase family protein [Desulfobacteraceae bacterium IS3]|nr:MAG: sulfotransferase family protein [Desulfobacteraceae bacterium IS3]